MQVYISYTFLKGIKTDLKLNYPILNMVETNQN